MTVHCSLTTFDVFYLSHTVQHWISVLLAVYGGALLAASRESFTYSPVETLSKQLINYMISILWMVCGQNKL